MILLDALLLTVVITYIIDSSGILFDLSKSLWKMTHSTPWKGQMIGKPLGCSVCMTFWLQIVTLSVSNLNWLYILVIATTMSILSPLISKSIQYILHKINSIDVRNS